MTPVQSSTRTRWQPNICTRTSVLIFIEPKRRSRRSRRTVTRKRLQESYFTTSELWEQQLGVIPVPRKGHFRGHWRSCLWVHSLINRTNAAGDRVGSDSGTCESAEVCAQQFRCAGWRTSHSPTAVSVPPGCRWCNRINHSVWINRTFLDPLDCKCPVLIKGQIPLWTIWQYFM